MTKFFPKNNNGFEWFNIDLTYFKGYFYNSEGLIYKEKEAINYFNNITCKEDFVECLKSINGLFSIVIITPNECYMSCDTTCIFPIFYSFNNNSLTLSDDIVTLKTQTKNNELDKESVYAFKGYGHTLSKKTLLNNIYQLQSNEYIIFRESQIYSNGFYFSYAVKNYSELPYNTLKSQISKSFENSFSRLINSLKGKTAVIPLSGGFDSRLIAVMLKKNNFENVICFTYGKKDNIDMKLSKKVAESLNYKWCFIEYTDSLVEGYLNHNNFKEYCNSVFNHTSMLFMQEYFAIKHLKENNLIPSNSVFIPGHDGGALGGGYHLKTIPKSVKIQALPSAIYKNYIYSERINSNKTNSITEIKKTLLRFNTNYKKLTPHSVYEDYIFKEITSKVIINSSKVYNHFGYELRLPFWDIELLETFKHIPLNFKANKKIYVDVISDFFNQFALNFDKEIKPSLYTIHKQNIKNKLKPLFPYFILRKFLLKNDWLNSKKITDEMITSMKKNNLPYNSKIKAYNEINIQWYLYFCKDLIKK